MRAIPAIHWLLLGIVTSTGVAAQSQQTYPNRPIRFIVPYAPGGSTDVIARFLGQKLTERWGQPVVVDNRPGGNTIIGTEALTRASPDGHTLLMMAIAHAIIPNLLKTPYHPVNDFSPVATAASGELVLVLHPSLPANNVRELIALAKAKPGQLNYASASTGGPLHLAGELFNMMAGVKTLHIPYKGGGPALTDLIGGQVQMMFSPLDGALPHIRSGRVKAIAISGSARSAALPDVPTFTEAGLAGFSVRNWFGVLAPARTPMPVVEKVSAEIGSILSAPDIREKLTAQGLDPYISTPAQFTELIRSDFALYGKIIRAANIKLEN